MKTKTKRTSTKKLGRPFLRNVNGAGVRRKNYTFSLDPATYDTLKEQAEQEKCSMSRTIEKAVDQYCK